jgi:hypothetical protein
MKSREKAANAVFLLAAGLVQVSEDWMVAHAESLDRFGTSTGRHDRIAQSRMTAGNRARNGNFATRDQGPKMPHFRERRPGSV